MAVPRTHLVFAALLATLIGSAGCNSFRILPQSTNAHEARLSKDGFKLAVRVTKKGFCLGYLAVFHGDDGKEGERPQERCTTAKQRTGAAEGEHDLDSLTQFLAEARKKSGKVHVTVRAEAGVTPDAVRRVIEAMKSREAAKDTKDALSDFVVSESQEGL